MEEEDEEEISFTETYTIPVSTRNYYSPKEVCAYYTLVYVLKMCELYTSFATIHIYYTLIV